MQQWLQSLFPTPTTEPGQGLAWRLSHTFPWPAWVLLLFGIVTALYVIYIYGRDASHLSSFKRLSLTALRLLSVAVLLVILSEITLSVERIGLPFVIVLLDNSASMATRDEYPGTLQSASIELLSSSGFEGGTRFDLARSLLLKEEGRLLKSLTGQHKLRVYAISEQEFLLGQGDYLNDTEVESLLPELRKLEPAGEETRLGQGVRRVLNDLRGTPPTAMVLLSDGVNTDGESLAAAARFAKQRSVPLYTVVVGNTSPALDIAMTDVVCDDVAFVNDPLTITYKLSGTGFHGQPVQVVLHKKDDPTPLVKEQVSLENDGRAKSHELSYTPTEVGELDLVIEAIPLPKETNVRNNSELRHISVRKEKIRVLLVDGLPRWEFRELKYLLEREKTVELKTVLQDSDADFAAEDRTALTNFPVNREDLFQYDVVLFGDVSLGFLSTGVQENLREFVKTRGGGVLFFAGERHNPVKYVGSPLESLLPIEPALAKYPNESGSLLPFTPELTVEGRKGTAMFRFGETELESQHIWQHFPGTHWMVETPVLKPGTVVYVAHPTKTGPSGKLPLICMHRFGAGKVMFHATDETWRWRFRVGDMHFGRYWVQAIRFLSRSKQLGKDRGAELVVDRKSYSAGDTVELRVRFIDDQLTPTASDGVTVVVERAGDPQRQVTLRRIPEARNVFEGQLSQVLEGNYHVWVATPSFAEAPPSQDFRVDAPARETRVLRADAAEMARAAELTLGRTYTIETASKLVDDIPPGLPTLLKAENPLRLWNHWLALVLFGGILSLEWILRKRWRLV